MRAIEISINLSDAPRRLLHAEVSFPVSPGHTASFTTPLWVQEYHVPLGPVGSIAGLVFSCSSNPSLPWKRDPLEPYIYHVDIPDNVDSVHASFDAIVDRAITRKMVTLQWESVLMHPAHKSIHNMRIRPSIVLPTDWDYSTALQAGGESVEVCSEKSLKKVHFGTTTVVTLQDSPVLAARYLNQIPITPDGRHLLCVAAGEERLTKVPEERIEGLARMVAEVLKVFPDPPYRQYRFLMMLGGNGAGGLEHFESTSISLSRETFLNAEEFDQLAWVLTHEYVHAWCGKRRRPVGHLPDTLTEPLDGRLLWVYEGLTDYYGRILSARSGITSRELFLKLWADAVASMEYQSGRVWRSIEDSGACASVVDLYAAMLTGKISLWGSWARAQSDYYTEGALLWLEIDTLIRKQTKGERSLDDFATAFFAGTGPHRGSVIPYSLEKIAEALNDIAPHDWAALLSDRTQIAHAHVNTRGIENAGFSFYGSQEPSDRQKDLGSKLRAIWYSIGLHLNATGMIYDVSRHSAVDHAGFAPTQKILHFAGQPFSVDALLREISQADQKPISVTLEQDGEVWTSEIPPCRGIFYPALREHSDSTLLDAIMAPRAGP